MKFLANIILTMAASLASGQVWTSHNESSVWECVELPAQVNATSMPHTLHSQSLAGCAYHCTMAARKQPASPYHYTETGLCHCNSQLDRSNEEKSQPNVRYCTLDTSVKVDKTDSQQTRTTYWPYKRDCATIYKYYSNKVYRYLFGRWEELNHKIKSKEGVYGLNPDGGEPIYAWCDMDGGGATVIQRRLGGTENFNRNWSDYVTGFGDPTGEHWLGLKALHRLTKDVNNYYGNVLRITLHLSDLFEDPEEWPYLLYMPAWVGNEGSNYELSYSRYSTTHNLGDIFHGRRWVQFSTPDRDNYDGSTGHLAAETKSGWWLFKSNEANPNSPYAGELSDGNGSKTGGYISWPAVYEGIDVFHVKQLTVKLAFKGEYPK